MGTRRDNGAGTLTQLASGSWRAQVMVGGRRQSVTGKTKQETQRKLRDLLHDTDRGVLPVREKLTTANYLMRWIEDVKARSVRPSMLSDYRNAVVKHAIPAFGLQRLDRLQPADLDRLYSGMLAAGYGPKHVRNVHGVLHAALAHAVRTGLAIRNVASLATPPRVPRAELHTLSAEQVRLLLDTSEGTRIGALVAVAVGTGMRQAEALALRWSDVDLDTGTARVVRQLGRDGLYSEPKTGSGRRTVHLAARTVAALRTHRSAQLEARLLAGSEWEEHDLVFTTWQGRPLNARNVITEWHRLLKTCGLQRMPWHGLRHTAATLMLVGAANPRAVQEQLGHSLVSVTLGIYAHVTPSMRRDAADALSRALAG